jgi:3-oxoacid CoA-transferase
MPKRTKAGNKKFFNIINFMKQVSQITAEQAAALVKDGDTIFGGGFGMTGNPVHLLHALAKTQTRNLTYIGNNVGEPNLGGANCY